MYGPVAAAPPDQEAVEVTLLPYVQVSLSAATLLDMARAEDTARWPVAVAREREAARLPYAQARESTEQAGRGLVSWACRCRRWSSPPRWTW